VSTPDRQIAPGVGHGQTSATAGPSANCEWPCAWAGGTAAAGKQTADEDGGDEHQFKDMRIVLHDYNAKDSGQ
jgi:hypothetical protein